MSDIFYGFELLLFKRFLAHPEQWVEWRGNLAEKINDAGVIEIEDVGEIPQSLWFLSVALHKRQRALIQLIKYDVKREQEGKFFRSSETLLSKYLHLNQFTEFQLDSIFKYGEDNRLPSEIFSCPNVRKLSLKYNGLDYLPADIGRMSLLESLALTNNKLQVQSIPYSLSFCSKLNTLLLDNNLLDALPGFLLQMPSLKTVHRHGNHNYFKATFMWYHTDVHYRIIPLTTNNDKSKDILQPASLEFWAAKSVIGAKKDFFNDSVFANTLKDYISEIYSLFHICHYCSRACLYNVPGFKVITFKNPYLGNTCVPFQHWACSIDCARALEVPARNEQIAAACELDLKYEQYIHDCQEVYRGQRSSPLCVCSSDSSVVNLSRPKQPDTAKCTCVIS